MQVNVKKLGQVVIDSGTLVVGDPHYVGSNPEFCVQAPTGSGDGTFDVVELEIEGVKYFAVNLDSSVGSHAKAMWQRGIDKKEQRERPNGDSPKPNGSQEDQTE